MLSLTLCEQVKEGGQDGGGLRIVNMEEKRLGRNREEVSSMTSSTCDEAKKIQRHKYWHMMPSQTRGWRWSQKTKWGVTLPFFFPWRFCPNKE